MIGFFLIFSANLLVTAIYLLFQSVGGAALGAKVEEVNLFFLGPVFSVQVGKIRFCLGFFPTGGSVKFGDEFQAFAPLRKILIACCGLFAYVLIALLCLGWSGAWHHVGTGYGQLLRGALSPISVGAKLIAALADAFQHHSYRVGLGILAAKFFAFNSLPLGMLSGGFIARCLLEMAGLRSDKATVRLQQLQWLGYFAALLLCAAWTIALIVILITGV